MAYNSTLKGKWRIDVADSVEDMIATSAIESAPNWTKQRYSRDSGFSYNMLKTRTHNEAVNLARLGWPEGRSKMSDAIDAAKFVQTNSTHRAEELDVGGAYPFVPAAAAGDPMCMVRVGLEQSKTKPIFRFMVGGFISSGVQSDAIMRRGAAILSWVDKLEAEGGRCELLYNLTCAGGDLKYTISTAIKRADEPLDIDRAAFVLAHPSMFRRIAFGCYERHADVCHHLGTTYGYPSNDIHPDLQVAHSIYFASMSYTESCWHSAEAAEREVSRIITDGLQHGDEARDSADGDYHQVSEAA